MTTLFVVTVAVPFLFVVVLHKITAVSFKCLSENCRKIKGVIFCSVIVIGVTCFLLQRH